MSKIKSLLSFALAATMLFSTVLVGVNAEDATPKNGTLNIGTATVEVGEPTATVDFTLTFDEAVKSPHSLCTIVSDYELTNLAVKSVDGTVVADDENLAEGDDDLVSSATVKISNNGLNLAAKKVIFESGVDSNAPVVTTIVFTATFDTSAAVAGTSVVSAAIDATNYDENTFALTVNAGKIVVEAKHEAVTDWSYDADNHWHACVVDGCTDTYDVAAHEWGEGVETKPATETETGVMTYTCGVCPATKTEDIPVIEPECDHANATSVVTARPTKDTEGERTFTCDCGETWTKSIPVATLKTEADGDTFKISNTLALNNSIEIAFRVRKAFVDDAVDAYAIFYKDKYDNNGEAIEPSITYKYKEHFVPARNNTRYDVNCDDVTSPEMSSNVLGEVYRELPDGTFEYLTIQYSIVTYAYEMFGQGGDKLDTLLMDMLNYGTAAQEYCDYNLANPANEAYDMFADYVDCASETAQSYTNYSAKEKLAGDNYKINLSRQLDLNSKILIVAQLRNETTARPRPAYSGDMTNVKAKCEYTAYSGETETIWIPASELTYENGMYSVAFDKFTTVEIDSKVTISIYDGETLISDTVTYSIGSYLEELKDPSSGVDPSSELYVLVENMVKYCTAAINYF